MATIVPMDKTVPTTIQVDEDTRQALLRYASELQANLGRKVTFNEAIRTLIHETRASRQARSKFEHLFGALAGEKGLLEELEEERRRERTRLEAKA